MTECVHKCIFKRKMKNKSSLTKANNIFQIKFNLKFKENE